MKYCEKCGKELFDEAVVCPGCGCSAAKPAAPAKQRPKMNKKTKLLCIIGGVVLAVAIIAAVLFMPRNIKLDDLTKEPSKISCLIKYGLPTRMNGDEWDYRDKMKFHGTEVELFTVEFSDNSYSVLDIDDEEIMEVIEQYCDLERDNIYAEYTYENLRITSYGFGIHVEVIG